MPRHSAEPQPANQQIVGPDAVGSRVSIRLLAGGKGPSGGPAMRDVVGVLESVEVDPAGAKPHCWIVRRRDGTTERLVVDQVVTAKVVPAPTGRLRRAQDVTVAELEHIAAAGWRPLDDAPLGDWLLRASEGFTGRANSVLPLGTAPTDLDAALERVDGWYRERGLRARFQVPLPYAADLDAALDARGWPAYNPTDVLVADVAQVLVAAPDRHDLPIVEIAYEPTDEWLAVYNYRGQPLPSVARAVLVNADAATFASIREEGVDGTTTAVARAALTGAWVGVTAVDVVQSARRRGLATYIVRALVADAQSRGARHVYLQVAHENRPARAMYDALGFTQHHWYQYRVAPSHHSTHEHSGEHP